jgi:Fe-S cluster assembly protein SufD
MTIAQEKLETVNALIDALALPDGGWSTDARADAVARLRDAGLPGRRDEYWRYTRPDALTAVSAPSAAVLDDGEPQMFDGLDRLQIVFVDGVFDADASDDLSLEGVSIERLAAVSDLQSHWAGDLYGALEKRGQTPVARPLATLNTGFATDGVLIHVTGKPSRPINLVYRHKSDSSDAILHHVVKVDTGAEATILENGPAAARFNNVTEVEIADGGSLHHVRSQGRDHERRAITHIFARMGANASFKSFTMTVNGVLTRNECVVELLGDESAIHVAGVCVGDGGDFHHDDTVFITHDSVNCESRQVFKKVLRNGATGVFQGKILVKPGAQKTDGYQMSQSLLLDEDSQFLAKPELEIYADDVACSHGSTSGAIDEDQLFYLRARGVSHADGIDMLTLSFLAQAMDEIDDETLSDHLLGRLEGWLARRR